ncbi:MAG TPA: nicotinate (nicotinamide) nucleotide adenylyltransferase [Acidimicrobiales bacterium]|nr:nicotinate (nicotinamide) nucleotide adenylyltransferase [Acidimicrobiales bacterium]
MPQRRPERIGVLGGTFDPPHEGHLDAARRARDILGLDRVLLVVANDPWQKSPRTPAEDRYAMVEAAVAGMDGVEASRMEIDRGGPSYTVETVETLINRARRADRPAPEIFLVVGEDLVDDLDSWNRVDDLRAMVTLAVVSRPGGPRPPHDPPGWRVVRVEGGGVNASSSGVRDELERGIDVAGEVPAAVIRCIRRRGLYAVPR